MTGNKTPGQRIARNWELYLFILPAFGLIALFHYVPIYGLQLAFKRFLAVKGIWASRGPGCRTSASSSTAHPSS